MYLTMPSRDTAREACAVQGMQNNLYSITNLCKARQIPIFDSNIISMHNARNTTIKVSRADIVEIWFTNTGMHRVFLVRTGASKHDVKTLMSKKSPGEILYQAALSVKRDGDVYKRDNASGLRILTCGSRIIPTKLPWK